MVPRGGTLFLLLLLLAGALGTKGGDMPGNKPDLKMMKKLMWKCKEQGYRPPLESLMKSIFNSSDSPAEESRSVQPSKLLLFFQEMLEAVSQQGDPLARMPSIEKMKNMMWNSSQLPFIIDQMRNRSEESVCFVRAFVAPLSWKALTTPEENITDMDDYEKLLWAIKPALRDITFRTMMLPKRLALEKVFRMMKLLKEMHKDLPENQRGNVVIWLKQQMAQNNFSCTTEVNSYSGSMLPRCNSSLSWLSAEAAGMLGPYLSNLRSEDVDSSPKELCGFFRTHGFPQAVKMSSRMKPSLARRFLQKCFSGEDFEQRVEKLGSLACYYDTDSDLAPELSKKLLPQLDECDNPQSKKLKWHLVRSMLSKHNLTQIAGDLGSSISYLSPENVSAISWSDLKEIQQNTSVRWTPAQMYALVKKRLQGVKCKQMTSEEVLDLKSLASGLPICVLKNVIAMKMLMDKKELRNITNSMRRGQLKAVLQRLAKDVNPLELVQKLDNDLLCSMSLNYLAKVNITAVDQVNNKTWRPAQALYLAQKMKNMGQLHFRKLRSLLQGVTCPMYENLPNENVPDMVEAIEENPQWLSKSQTICAARTLLQYLERKRPNYLESIADEELDMIPTVLLISQPPWKLMGLPDAVCSTFLDKMENANLSSLPPLSPSRLALVKRALRCLGDDFSKMTSNDAARLGPLLCELLPSQLRLMTPEVLKFSLTAAASCEYIPLEHSVDLIKLVIQTFGEPSQWSPELMEDLGPLLLLDDDYTAALPNKPWMIGVLHFLRSRRMATRALVRKHFDVITSSPSNADQKRVASSVKSGDRIIRNPPIVPTEELIAQVGRGNVFWLKEELDLMSSDTFGATVETLGTVPEFSPEQLAKLKEKAVKVFGSVEQMSESVVTQLGCIIQGFSMSELEKLPFLLDNMERIGHCGFDELQVASIWKAVANHNGLSAPQLGSVEMVALDRFICGLTSSELMQLNLEQFKDAVYAVGSAWCSRRATRELRSLAVLAFGVPSSWDEAQVSVLGNIIAGLDPSQMASLSPPVLQFIRKSCIPLIPPENLASLSIIQLEALGPERAARVTGEQRAALTEDQLDALMRARAGLRSDTTGPSPLSVYSGGPPMNALGILTFMKPILVLLVGLLLI